ncbi:MAG: hypothetical protein KC503_02530 [Myxococcales bacterium]|nr:hypothetical protein [Myxococcales bacterium]
MAADTAELEKNQQIYTDFDEFLKSAITEYYKIGGKSKRGNFIALIIASGEAASLAMDSLKSGSGVRKLAVGAVGVVALRIGLRYALSGPLGILLAGATAASLIAYFVKNRGEIAGKITRYRTLVATLKESYAKLQSDHRDGRLDDQQRDLMVDGLMKRFLSDLDAEPADA